MNQLPPNVHKFLYLSLLTLINVSALFATNLYPANEAAGILADPQDIHDRILGSKIVIALEQCMLFGTWGVKFCIWGFQRKIWQVSSHLTYYTLLTPCSRQIRHYEIILWGLLTYIILGLLITEICYLTVFCKPFSQYWAVPVINDQCATYAHYSIMQATFNISSDFMFMVIPIHMVFIQNKKMKNSRRWIVGFVFGLGVFTIIAAVLNK